MPVMKSAKRWSKKYSNHAMLQEIKTGAEKKLPSQNPRLPQKPLGMTEIAYISIGSNLNNPQQQVITAVTELNEVLNTKVAAVSHWYRTSPMGPQDQPDYINGVAKLETKLSPEQLLKALQTIEDGHFRERKEHWGARTLDLDILLYGNQTIDLPNLQIPHPGITTRNFVLLPLADINPQLVLPDGTALATLLESCSSKGIVRLSSGDICGTTG